MRLILEIVSGPLLGKKVFVEENQSVRVGRTAKSDFPTDDGFMSGEHFVVEGHGKVWHVKDLKSRNGTKVNGKRVSSVELSEGDQVHAGSTDFIVRIEMAAPVISGPIDPKLLVTLPPAIPPDTQQKEKTGEVSSLPKKSQLEPPISAPIKRPEPSPLAESLETARMSEPEAAEIAPVPKAIVEVPPKPITAPAAPLDAMQLYEAVTPGGRLLHFLQTQSQPLFALIDATQEKKVLTLLRESEEEYRSLYRDAQNASIAPYLISFSPDSMLLRKMVNEGWSHNWGVYLTCPLPLAQLREYFRRELMVSLPDGVELFSRFYDPRFFRVFLSSSTPAEAERFFGPVNSYLMEAEKPEIVLEFTRTSGGVEKKGHLLSELI